MIIVYYNYLSSKYTNTMGSAFRSCSRVDGAHVYFPFVVVVVNSCSSSRHGHRSASPPSCGFICHLSSHRLVPEPSLPPRKISIQHHWYDLVPVAVVAIGPWHSYLDRSIVAVAVAVDLVLF